MPLFMELVWIELGNLFGKLLSLLRWKRSYGKPFMVEFQPTFSKLAKWGITIPNSGMCVFCVKTIEWTNHLFYHCHFAWKVWQHWCSRWNIHFIMSDNLKSFIFLWEA
ncbi:hypothetical protein GQ457_10G004960 [Hibiscus cannabinus]